MLNRKVRKRLDFKAHVSAFPLGTWGRMTMNAIVPNPFTSTPSPSTACPRGRQLSRGAVSQMRLTPE